jgi:hypothetical protein
VNFIAVKEDITERRRAESALLESAARLREVQGIAGIGSFRYVPGSPMAISDTLYDMLKLPRGAPPRYEALMNLVHPDDRPRAALTKAVVSGAPTFRSELRFVLHDGDVRTICAQGRIRRGTDGRVIEVIGAMQDVTERAHANDEIRRLNEDLRTHAADLERRVAERTAELEAANKELEAFDYSVSHDLRAPLARIRGFSAMLLEESAGKTDERCADLTRRIGKAGDEMDALIGDLLGLSTVSRGEVVRRDVDLSSLANAVFDELQRTQPSRRIDFVVESGIRARADPGLLRVVLQNLIGNAWKFTSKRDVARIEVGREEVDGRPVFFVRDDGAGFDPANAGKLFAPFRRLHARSEFAGTGIGLATVQRAVRRHGGRVWAVGQVDQGAVFRFTLAP